MPSILNPFFTREELALALETTPEHAEGLLRSNDEILTLNQVKLLEPYFPLGKRKKTPPKKEFRERRYSREKLQIPDDISGLQVEIESFSYYLPTAAVARLTYKRRTGTFVIVNPLEWTVKGILNDIFSFADLRFCHEGNSKNLHIAMTSRMYSTYHPYYERIKSRRDFRFLTRIFRDEYELYRNLALNEVRNYCDIYVRAPELIIDKPMNTVQENNYSFNLWKGNCYDFYNYIYKVDCYFKSEICPITKTVTFQTKFGEKLGAKVGTELFLSTYKGVEPVDRPFRIFKRAPVFADDIVSENPVVKENGLAILDTASINSKTYYNRGAKDYKSGHSTLVEGGVYKGL